MSSSPPSTSSRLSGLRLWVFFVVLISSFIILYWWLGAPADRPYRSHTPYTTDSKPTTTLTEPTEVFQKAFWKRPTAEDHILGAERREWSGKDGVQRWSWRLTVQPSAALVEHLITQNAFMLIRSEKPSSHGGLPDMDTQHLTNATGTFHILWNEKKNLLHAYDSGAGFRPGAPEPSKALTAGQTAGRLPLTPPPNPQ